ncbi:hypothetical protein DSL72_000932 [Monilinia vaccinii-corymbosi]|uniref:DUF6590 domain-containing protein n=1 Tax=Monilinia vaccinii-corymbosi TaxID=61207 RepID=A0A8A3PAG5_9HELO|nr:hypothetical protein DSL72_000932 [Monilinia vaccinii-corymbosi]
MDHHYQSRGKGKDQTTAWTGWLQDNQGNFYRTRIGPTGVQEYENQYQYSETLARSDTPRTPGQAGSNAANNQQPMHSGAITAGYGAYTHSQPGTYAAVNHQATSRPSYYTPAPINNYRNYSNTMSHGYGAVPPTNTPNTNWSSSYPSTSNNSWLPAVNVAPSSVEATTHGINSMSLATPRAPPLRAPRGAFPPEIADALPLSTKHIVSAPIGGKSETLDARYMVHAGFKQNDFWRVGRVFMMLWTEPAAESKVPAQGGTRNGSHFSTTFLGQQAYSEIRRFVVMVKGHGSSICCPIHTYSNQATLKPNLPAPKCHTIIYTSPVCPNKHQIFVGNHWLSEDLTLEPIQVIREQQDSEGELHRLSRLNYSKVYTVEHYVRVMNIGMVARNSIIHLPKSLPLVESNHPASEQHPQSNHPASEQHHRSNHPSKRSSGQYSSHHNTHHKHHKSHKDGHY